MNLKCLWIVLFLIGHHSLAAQKLKKGDIAIIETLKAHISYLADDKLEGRRAGTNGEKLAREYIKSQFEKVGLETKGDNHTFYQSFQIADGKNYHGSFLFINDQEIKKINKSS